MYMYFLISAFFLPKITGIIMIVILYWLVAISKSLQTLNTNPALSNYTPCEVVKLIWVC